MSSKKTLFMETTEITAERSAGEISSELIKGGATQIATDFTEGKITGLRWTMRAGGRDLLFSMPARVQPVYDLLLSRRSDKGRWISVEDAAKLRSKADRVAWRQLLRWVQAQLAMIDTGMVEASEVFLPYLDDGTGQTLFLRFKESEFKLLAAPKQ